MLIKIFKKNLIKDYNTGINTLSLLLIISGKSKNQEYWKKLSVRMK
jgi:hypothetical protein